MASLPDLNTSNVGFIAYYNVIDDGGAQSIDPEDMLTDTGIESYTLYDNGFTADYNNPINSLPVTVRAKGDGWITAHTSREENYSFGVDPNNTYSDVRGWYNFATGDSDALTNDPDLIQNSLERTIQSLQSNLSNSGSYVYNTADVNLYNYEYPNATNVSLASVYAKSENTTDTGGISATSTTTLDAAVAHAKIQSRSGNSCFADFDGNTILETTAGQAQRYATADLLANSFFSSSGTENLLKVEGDSVGLQIPNSHITAVVVWH